MSGFPWTSLITAVVPAAAVLAGAALTGRQNNQAKRLTALKKDYARFVQAATALIEHCDQIQDTAGPGPGFERVDWDVITQMVSGLALARALVDLAGSFKARQAAGAVSQVADQVAQGVSAAVYSAGSRSGSHSPNDRATYYLRLALTNSSRTICVAAIWEFALSKPSAATACGRTAKAELSASVSMSPIDAKIT
jgi:hypothetical protein